MLGAANAQERVTPGGNPPAAARQASDPASTMDMDVTVLAFAQWVSEMKARNHNSQHHMQAEMSIIRNAIASNGSDLLDFKRHSAAIQQQMQNEISEIRESLGGVFQEITSAVRNNSAADQDLRMRIQTLSEQAIRSETAFAQLADAAEQSQSKLRSAVQEMQLSSERMRDELGNLTRHSEGLEVATADRADRLATDVDQLTQDTRVQLDRRKEHLKKMVGDVMQIGESLQGLITDLGSHKKVSEDSHTKLSATLSALDRAQSSRQQAQAMPASHGQTIAVTSTTVRCPSPAPVRQAPTAVPPARPSEPLHGQVVVHHQRPMSPLPQRPASMQVPMQIAGVAAGQGTAALATYSGAAMAHRG